MENSTPSSRIIRQRQSVTNFAQACALVRSAHAKLLHGATYGDWWDQLKRDVVAFGFNLEDRAVLQRAFDHVTRSLPLPPPIASKAAVEPTERELSPAEAADALARVFRRLGPLRQAAPTTDPVRRTAVRLMDTVRSELAKRNRRK